MFIEFLISAKWTARLHFHTDICSRSYLNNLGSFKARALEVAKAQKVQDR
jgi:hypothetical protein